MTKTLLRRSIILAIIALLGAIPFLTSDQPVSADDDDGESYEVAVLVVDSYRTMYNRRGELKPRYREDENCVLAAQGAGFATRGAGFATRGAGFATRGAGFATRGAGFATRGAGFATRGAGFATRGADGELFIREAHGEIIELELDELNYYYGDDVDVDIVPVRVNDYQTKKLVRTLRRVIERSDYDFYVINMSFTIVPCDVVHSFEEYLAEISDDPDYPSLVQVGEYLESLLFASNYGQVADDDFGDLFEDYPNVVGVASAGNFGNDFPYYPAAFDGVISVSGSSDYNDFYSSASFNPQTNEPLLQGDFGNASNYGEVMMPGQLLDIFGTSYAAPRLSYAIALYLAEVGPNYCLNDRGSFGLDSDVFANFTLVEAASAWCPDMLGYLPTELPWDIDGDGWVYLSGYIDVESSDYAAVRGSWTYEHLDEAGGGVYMLSSESRYDHIEVDFTGPYVDVFFIDGVVDGQIDVYVDDRRVDRIRLSAAGEPTRRALDYTRLGQGNHTLELFVRSGRIAIDGVYSTFFVQQ